MSSLFEVEWRKIPGYSRYSASSNGDIRRDVRIHNSMPGLCTKQLRQISKRGSLYWRVSITSDGGSYDSKLVHSLVAMAWYGERPKGMVVRHLDGNSQNNSPWNLAYGTHGENSQDAISHGSQVRGSNQHLAKLSEIDVRKLKLKFLAGDGCAKLSREFGIAKTTCHAIIKGQTWTHVEPSCDLRTLCKKRTYGYKGGQKTSAHVGVSFNAKRGVWVARRYKNGKVILLGEFKAEGHAIKAVQKYDAELQREGLACPTGEVVPTIYGRMQRVWRLI